MIGKALVMAAALLASTPLQAQTSQGGTNSTQGITSGPAAGSPASMRSPQAGSLETKHQRQSVRDQSQSVRTKSHQSPSHKSDEAGATGSSTPPYTSPPR
jgi:hypothetical protein